MATPGLLWYQLDNDLIDSGEDVLPDNEIRSGGAVEVDNEVEVVSEGVEVRGGSAGWEEDI